MSVPDTPYLGSKISLISKAEIRYEGTLYTIDTKEATVALARVRSFGTEERKCDRPVPKRDEVYEYIIFRGKDIKDLHVCEPPVNTSAPGLAQDPAIVKSQPMAQQSFPSGQAPFGGGQYPAYGIQSYGFGSGGGHMYPPQAQFHQQVEPSGIPSTGSGRASAVPPTKASQRVSPTVDQGVQVNTKQLKKFSKAGSRGSTPPPNRKSPNLQPGHHAADELESKNEAKYDHDHHQHHGHHEHVQHEHHGHHDHPGHHGSDNRGPMGYQQNRRQDGRGRGRGGPRGGGPPGFNSNYHRGGPRGGRGPRRGAPGGNRQKQQQLIKFESDFDFETANAQFDKDSLEKELKEKLIIKHDVSPADEKVVNGEKDVGSADEEVEDDSLYYDKAKSFFDNISCEASERARGVNQRPNWREERKINAETFGISSTREFNRNMYRSRGGRGRWGYRGTGGRGRGRGGGRNYNNRGGRRWDNRRVVEAEA